MVNSFFNHFKHQVGLAAVNFSTVDWRVLLTMSNYDYATEKDDSFLSTMTLDECDGANYARQALASEAWTKDATNNRSELTADPVVFSALGAGTRQNESAVLYIHAGADSANIPALDMNEGGFPFDGTGSDNTITFDAEGVIQL